MPLLSCFESARKSLHLGGEGILMSRCSVACFHRNPTVVSPECGWREGNLEFTGRRAFFYFLAEKEDADEHSRRMLG